MYVFNCTIDSNRHQLETKDQHKVAIDATYDKGIRDRNGNFLFYES